MEPARCDSDAEVGWVDVAKRDYRLADSSPFKGKATDGTDCGVDMEKLLAALQGNGPKAVSPAPPKNLRVGP